jgi:uncharacterized protein
MTDADERGSDAPLPRRPSHDDLRAIYASTRTIAVVGASADIDKPAHTIPRYLQAQGFRIIPVNPRGGRILGEEARPSLVDIHEAVDVVDVFRPAEEGPDIAREAARLGARVIWFQPGTQSAEASRTAAAAGLQVVTRYCMGAAHGMLGLGPGPDEERPR